MDIHYLIKRGEVYLVPIFGRDEGGIWGIVDTVECDNEQMIKDYTKKDLIIDETSELEKIKLKNVKNL